MDQKEFISSIISKLISDGIKNFPADFIKGDNHKELELPGKTLLIGEEFFGKYEIITSDGKSVLHAENYLLAKFIIYSNRNTPRLILVPSDENEVKRSILIYENYLDSLIRNVESDYRRFLPEEKNSNLIVNEIFRQLNLVRL